MAAHVLYNTTTGAVSGVLKINHSDDESTLLAANTPEGFSSMEIDSSDPVVQSQRGWSVVSGELVFTPPTSTELLAKAKAAKLNELTDSYANAKGSGVSYLGTTFMSDDNSQTLFAHALIAYKAIGSVPDDFFAVDAAYSKVPMNLEQLQGLIEAIAAQVWGVFQRWIAVRYELAAASTVEDVQAITW